VENALDSTGNPDVLRPTLGATKPIPRLVDAKDRYPSDQGTLRGVLALGPKEVPRGPTSRCC
jgi:hypothetical protein